MICLRGDMLGLSTHDSSLSTVIVISDTKLTPDGQSMNPNEPV